MNAAKRKLGLTYNSSSVLNYAFCLVSRVSLADSTEATGADNGHQGRSWVPRLEVL